MGVLAVIPARYESTRYPGKPLVDLRGATGKEKSLIQRSWEAAMSVRDVDRVVVATDDARIQATLEAFGARVVMTSTDCQNDTERCAEALDALGGDCDIVVNLQGDALPTPAWFIEDLMAAYPRWPSGVLEQLEGLEQLWFLERGVHMLCVEVDAKGRQFWELNNPEDVHRIEAMLTEMGQT